MRSCLVFVFFRLKRFSIFSVMKLYVTKRDLVTGGIPEGTFGAPNQVQYLSLVARSSPSVIHTPSHEIWCHWACLQLTSYFPINGFTFGTNFFYFQAQGWAQWHKEPASVSPWGRSLVLPTYAEHERQHVLLLGTLGASQMVGSQKGTATHGVQTREPNVALSSLSLYSLSATPSHSSNDQREEERGKWPFPSSS